MSSAPPIPGSTSAPAFRVRNARRGDSESLSALIVELGHPAGADTATVHWVMSHPEMEVIAGVDPQDRPIAMLSLSHRPQLRMRGRVITIDELVVAPAWRRKGVGRALLQRALDRARVLSAQRVDLLAEGDNAEITRAFLQACGFQEAPTRVGWMHAADFKRPR